MGRNTNPCCTSASASTNASAYTNTAPRQDNKGEGYTGRHVMQSLEPNQPAEAPPSTLTAAGDTVAVVEVDALA